MDAFSNGILSITENQNLNSIEVYFFLRAVIHVFFDIVKILSMREIGKKKCKQWTLVAGTKWVRIMISEVWNRSSAKSQTRQCDLNKNVWASFTWHFKTRSLSEQKIKMHEQEDTEAKHFKDGRRGWLSISLKKQLYLLLREGFKT